MSRLVDEIEEYLLFSARFGNSNLQPERIRSPIENVHKARDPT
jgi:hypothetical protein